MADVKICACGIAAVDCDYHKPQFTPISDGSVIYFRYDSTTKSWKRIPWESATNSDYVEDLLLP